MNEISLCINLLIMWPPPHTKPNHTKPYHITSLYLQSSITAISIHNATLLSCHFQKIVTVSHFRLVFGVSGTYLWPFPMVKTVSPFWSIKSLLYSHVLQTHPPQIKYKSVVPTVIRFSMVVNTIWMFSRQDSWDVNQTKLYLFSQ